MHDLDRPDLVAPIEELHPSPNMLGATPLERARVREAERICEMGVLNNIGTVYTAIDEFGSAADLSFMAATASAMPPPTSYSRRRSRF